MSKNNRIIPFRLENLWIKYNRKEELGFDCVYKRDKDKEHARKKTGRRGNERKQIEKSFSTYLTL